MKPKTDKNVWRNSNHWLIHHAGETQSHAIKKGTCEQLRLTKTLGKETAKADSVRTLQES